jgi:hypothetical protein
MPTSGTTASSMPQVELTFKCEPDPSRFQRLANLLFSPSTTVIGSTAITMAVSS